jgi:hypothetical protein
MENNTGLATVFVLVGVGLEVAAAAIAAGGSRPTPLVPVYPPGRPPAPGYPAHVQHGAPHSAPPSAPQSPSWPGAVSGG